MDEMMRSLVDLCREGDILVFTGAGISAESGIPTFRGKGGLWEKFDPEKVASIEGFRRDPSQYWRFFLDARLPILKEAKPNPAHYAVAEMQKMGLLTAVVTQNIDGLHQAAGATDVLELHGNTRRFLCTVCSFRCELERVLQLLEEALPPRCPECGAVLRPDVVLFGEALPHDVLTAAFEAARRSKLALCVGSSLLVYPAAFIPQHAQKLAIINLDPTPFDASAEVVLHRKASEVLPQVVDALKT